MYRKFIPALTLALAAAATPVRAASSVDCGSVTCFQVRAAAEGKDADTRAGHAMDVINKYLGGKVGKVTLKPAGKNVRLQLNNEPVILVTPADATAEKQKSPAALASQWAKRLSQAFEATKAQK